MSEALREFSEAMKELGVFEVEPLMPRVFVNSFPKSGTHFANLICAHLAKRQEPKHWLGTFAGNSWTTQWIPLKNILPVIYGQPKGTWYQGHVGYREEIEEAFWL